MTYSKEDHLNMLKYYWEQKGDIERYSDFENAIVSFPEVGKAWADYKMAKKMLTAVINRIRA